jgi:hypothetical protein
LNTQKSSEERREFFRVNFKTPFKFHTYSATEENSASKTQVAPQEGSSSNISPSGILFQTRRTPPAVSSILWMNVDLRTLTICREIEKRAIVHNNGLLGRVVRVEENPKSQNLYEVGVCFLTQDQKNSRPVQQILTELSKSS